MSTQSLLLAGGALVVAGVGAFFFLTGGSPDGGFDPESESVSREGTISRPQDAEGPVDLSALASGAEQRQEVSRVAALAGPAVEGAMTSNLGGADGRRTVRVEIQAPLGAPPDPDLRVVAWSDEELEAQDLDWTQARVQRRIQRRASADEAVRTFQQAESNDEVRWCVVEAGDQRSIEVAFDATARLGRVHLTGRYLYLAEPVEVDLTGELERVVLEPEIGVWIVGTVRTQGASVAPGEDGSFGTVLLRGGSFGGGRGGRRGGGFTERRYTLDDDSLAFEFRGVRPDLSVRLSADLPTLAPGSGEVLELRAGTKITSDVTVVQGGAVEGRVVDLAGEPVSGALVAANLQGGGWGRARSATRDAVTGADGAFRVVGLEAGSYRVEASLEGWRSGRTEDTYDVEAASTRTGLLVELDPGFVIRGKVVLPGGAPAGGTKLRLEQSGPAETGQPRNPWRGARDNKERKEAETGPDGTFSFVALTSSPARIAAAYEAASDAAFDARASEEPSRPFAAIVEDVEPREAAKVEPIVITLAPTLSIRGRVVDETGAPITAFGVRAAREGYSSRSGAGDGARGGFESEDGTFELAGVTGGSWRVSVNAEDHSSPEDQTRTVTVPQTGEPLLFTLPRLAAVRGLVVDPSGLPVAGARVRRVQENGGFGGFGGRGGPGVETDEAGAFELAGLTPGAHRVEATSDSWAASLPQTVEAVPGSEEAQVVLALRLGGTISGVVRDDGGAPLANRRVNYAKGGGPMAMLAGQGSTTTDASGRFRFEHVAPDTWTVTASPSDAEMMETMRGARDQSAFFELMGKNLTAEVTVAEGEEAFVELGAEPLQPVTVVGAVTRAGAPVTDGAVTFAKEGGDLFANLVRGTLGGDGTYRLELKRPGSYVVSLERGRRRNQYLIEVAPAAEDGAPQRVDLAVPEGGIAGRVRTPDGKPAAGQRVSVEPRSSLSFARFDPRSATTDADGAFELLDLDPGTYTLRVGQGTFGFGQGRSEAYGRAVVNDIRVAEDSVTSGVDVRLSAPGRVIGEVVDSDGGPVAGATIFVRDGAGRPIESISTVRTDASGRFTYERVAPGTYVVSARTADTAAPDEGGVVVTEGEDAKVQLRVESATTLIVSTLDENEASVSAELSVVDADGREMTGLVGTELFQSFGSGISTSEQRVGPLPPGRYTVTATAADGRSESKRVTVRNRAESRVKLTFEAPK